MTTVDARAFAFDWIEAFNARDLPRILAHYADEVELVSPIYRDFSCGQTDIVRGKPALALYFAAALKRFPDLRFTLLEVAEGSRGLCLRYHSNVGDRIAIECVERDAAGRISRALCHYVPKDGAQEGASHPLAEDPR